MTMTCLSRLDEDKNIFKIRQEYQGEKKKRWNLYNEVEIKDGNLICMNGQFSVDELCQDDIGMFNQKCTFSNGVTLSYDISPG